MISGAPGSAGVEGEVDDALEEFFVGDAGGLGGFGEVFGVGELRVGVGFEEIDFAFGGEAEVHAGVAGLAQGPVDSLADVGDVLVRAGRKVGGRPGGDAGAFLIIHIPFHFRGDDAGGAFGEIFEGNFPDGQGLEAGVAHDGDVELAAFDVLLDDDVGGELLVDEAHAIDEFLLVGDDGGLGDADRAVGGRGFDDQGVGDARGQFHFFAERDDDEFGGADAVVAEDFFGEALVAGDHHAARVAAGVELFGEFEVAEDEGDVGVHAGEFLEQVEHDVGLEVFDAGADGGEVVAEAQGDDFVAESSEAGGDVVLGFEGSDFLLVEPLNGIGGDESLVHEDGNAELFHSWSRW